MTCSRAVRRLPVVAIALAAASLVLGACGSDPEVADPATEGIAATSVASGPSGSTAVAPTTTATSTGDDDTTTSVSKRTTTTGAGARPTTPTERPTPTVNDAAYTEFCQLFAGFDAQFEDATDDDPAVFDQIKAAFQQLTAAAPAEMKADIQTVNDYIQSITDANQMAQSPQAVRDASKRLGDRTQQKCGMR